MGLDGGWGSSQMVYSTLRSRPRLSRSLNRTIEGDGVLKEDASGIVSAHGHLVSGFGHPGPARLGFGRNHDPNIAPGVPRGAAAA